MKPSASRRQEKPWIHRGFRPLSTDVLHYYQCHQGLHSIYYLLHGRSSCKGQRVNTRIPPVPRCTNNQDSGLTLTHSVG